MKKTQFFLAIAALILVCTKSRVSAQIHTVEINYCYPSGSSCSAPAAGLLDFGGGVFGTFLTTDSLTINVNFDDGFDTTFKRSIDRTAGAGEYYCRPTHTYTFSGTFKPRIIVTAPSGASDTLLSPGIVVSSICATLSGRLYIDANANCTKNAEEENLRNTPILVVNTSTGDSILSAYTDDTGFYSFTLFPGTYTVIPNPAHYGSFGYWIDENFTASCPASGVYSFVVSTGGSVTKNFAYSCKAITAYDASTVIWSRGFVPGDSTYIMITGAGNSSWSATHSCLTMSTTATLTLDPKLTYLSSHTGMAPTSVSGRTITWNLPAAQDVVEFYAGVWVKVPTTATLGDTIRLQAYIAPTSYTDPVLSNNTYNYKRPVTSAYDPNMKEVAPTGNGATGDIAPNTDLLYTIHFQNTGTAPAKKVIITDVIDTDLDIHSLHFINATHNATMYVDGNTVKFRFDNINLPDSGASMEGSMGAITYAIKQKKSLSSGTKINNTAAIYFDYNSPVITNTTLNTIVIPANIQQFSPGQLAAVVFPNPANTKLTVNVANNANLTVTMTDMLGRIVALEKSKTGTITIATQNLPSGVYLIDIRDADGNQQNTKVMVKH